MWHKPCRTFNPWCLCIKTRCLSHRYDTPRSSVWHIKVSKVHWPPYSGPVRPTRVGGTFGVPVTAGIVSNSHRCDSVSIGKHDRPGEYQHTWHEDFTFLEDKSQLVLRQPNSCISHGLFKQSVIGDADHLVVKRLGRFYGSLEYDSTNHLHDKGHLR